MKVLISGLCGHMGKELEKLVLEGCSGAEATMGVDPRNDGTSTIPCVSHFSQATTDADVIVDFSHASMTDSLLAFATKNKIPLVIATTGQTPAQKTSIKKASKMIPIFFAANYSVGIALLCELAKKTAAMLPDAEIEIVEKHHDRKEDAPSGTALALADAIREVRTDATLHLGRSGLQKRTPNEIGIHAIRIGNVVGEHEVLIGTKNQTITLRHEAHSRALFAEGALTAAAFLIGKPAGLYGMKDMIAF